MKYVTFCCAMLLFLTLAARPAVAQAAKDVGRGHYVDALLHDGFQLLDDEQLTARVSEIGQKIVAASGNPQKYQFHFAIINDAIPTAISAAGGYVYVTTGLLRTIESEDELAAVLGHEVAHINERHPMHTGMGRKASIFWTIALTAASHATAQYAGNAIMEALGPLNPNAGLMAQFVSNIAGMATSKMWDNPRSGASIKATARIKNSNLMNWRSAMPAKLTTSQRRS